jgi:hypothetical protein
MQHGGSVRAEAVKDAIDMVGLYDSSGAQANGRRSRANLAQKPTPASVPRALTLPCRSPNLAAIPGGALQGLRFRVIAVTL